MRAWEHGPAHLFNLYHVKMVVQAPLGYRLQLRFNQFIAINQFIKRNKQEREG
jgi:hypothetical protein